MDFCYRVPGLSVDIERLQNCVSEWETKLMDPALADKIREQPVWTINLTHIPGLAGSERWWKHNRGHGELERAGVREEDFTVVNADIASTYIGDVMALVRIHHLLTVGTPFQGRCQLVWIAPEFCHKMHVDPHTPHRYHVPVFTHINCQWVFKKGDEFSLLHMPADGGVWYLDPVQAGHAVANMSPIRRCHLLMTDGVGAP